jgi:hypothetical protein
MRCANKESSNMVSQSRWGIAIGPTDGDDGQRTPLHLCATEYRPQTCAEHHLDNDHSPRRTSTNGMRHTGYESPNRRMLLQSNERRSSENGPWRQFTQKRRESGNGDTSIERESSRNQQASTKCDRWDRGMDMSYRSGSPQQQRSSRGASLGKSRRSSSLSSVQSEKSWSDREGNSQLPSNAKASQQREYPVHDQISRSSHYHGRVSPDVSSHHAADISRVVQKCASVEQRHRSSLGSRWGPRSTTAECRDVSTPDLVSTSPEESTVRQLCSMGKVALERKGPDDEKGRVLSQEQPGKSQRGAEDVASQTGPPIACIGFTTKESRAVETTELSEVSVPITVTVCRDGTNTISSESSTSTLSNISLLDNDTQGPPPHLPPIVTVQPLQSSIPARLAYHALTNTQSQRSSSKLQSFDAHKSLVSNQSALLKDNMTSSAGDGMDNRIPRNSGSTCGSAVSSSYGDVNKKVLKAEHGHSAARSGVSNVAKNGEQEPTPTFVKKSPNDSTSFSNAENGRKKERRVHKLGDCTDPSLVAVGARVAVYWDGEGRYYKGTVVKEFPGKNRPFYLRYDDGDEEWMSFEKERFRLLSVPLRESDSGDNKLSVAREHVRTTSSSSETKKRKIPSCETTSPGTRVAETQPDERNGGSPPPTKKQANTIVSTAIKDIRSVLQADESSGTHQEAALDCIKSETGKISACSMQSKKSILPRTAPTAKSAALSKEVANELNWVAAAGIENDNSDSETDEEEVLHWAAVMLGATRPIAARKVSLGERKNDGKSIDKPSDSSRDSMLSVADVPMSISEKVKLARRKGSSAAFFEDSQLQKKQAKPRIPKKRPLSDAELEQEAKRKKEQARPLTAAEISTILGDDLGMESSTWVRRSVRQPSKSSLSAPRVKLLLEKLLVNDSDMVVLKMKKYCSDLDTPCIVIDAVLDALEENSNCEALYIQVCIDCCLLTLRTSPV